MLKGNVLVTGGTGTLGHALARRVAREGWPCTLTIYSRDPMRQAAMRRLYPGWRYVLGDVCDRERLEAALYGHDVVLHFAAQKHIPEGEANPEHCYAVNVQGSLNVLHAALAAGVMRALLISTDKACEPRNVYGATKMIAERIWQQAAARTTMAVNICRYGNVLGSTGSVVQVWREAIARGETPQITDPNMTRFWITSDQAIDLVLHALDEPTGTVTIPRLPMLPMGRMAEWLLPEGITPHVMGLRPGEKLHETLLTAYEAQFIEYGDFEENEPGEYIRLWPTTGRLREDPGDYAGGYTSDRARQLTRDELLGMLA